MLSSIIWYYLLGEIRAGTFDDRPSTVERAERAAIFGGVRTTVCPEIAERAVKTPLFGLSSPHGLRPQGDDLPPRTASTDYG